MSAECIFVSAILKFEVLSFKCSLFTSSDNKDIVRLTNGAHADKVTLSLCVLLSHIGINLLKAILRIKLDQYTTSVRANVLNIQTVVWRIDLIDLNDSQQVH